MSELDKVARTIARMARPNMKARDLVDAVRKKHPKVNRKDLSRAAFLAMIQAADCNPENALQLQDLGLRSRGFEDEDDAATDGGKFRRASKSS